MTKIPEDVLWKMAAVQAPLRAKAVGIYEDQEVAKVARTGTKGRHCIREVGPAFVVYALGATNELVHYRDVDGYEDESVCGEYIGDGVLASSTWADVSCDECRDNG